MTTLTEHRRTFNWHGLTVRLWIPSDQDPLEVQAAVLHHLEEFDHAITVKDSTEAVALTIGERLNAIEITDADGCGNVVYVNWP